MRLCHGEEPPYSIVRGCGTGEALSTSKKQMECSYDHINASDDDWNDESFSILPSLAILYGDTSEDDIAMSSSDVSTTTSSISGSYVDDGSMEGDVAQVDEDRVADYQVSPPLGAMMAKGFDMHGFRVVLPDAEYVNVIFNSMGGLQQRNSEWKELERKRGYGWYKESQRSKFSSLLRCFQPKTHLPYLARKGIPPAWRRVVWLEASLARLKKKQYPYFYYHDLLSRVSHEATSIPEMMQADNDIKLDLARTFPGHTLLDTPEGRDTLHNVLLAYAAHNPSVGYCQSMNYVVAMLLVAMQGNARDAFWMLVTLVEDILYPGFYGQGLRGALIEMHACFELLKESNPRLAGHIDWLAAKDGVTVDRGYLTAEWLLSLFARSTPAETVMRMWDILFTSRRPTILFGAALAVFKIAEPQLLDALDYAALTLVFCDTFQTQLFHPDVVLAFVDQAINSFPDFNASLDRARKHALAHVP